MCGIFVSIGAVQIPLQDLLKYINAIKHRGPDRSSIKLYPSAVDGGQVVMAFHELSVMDIATTKKYQPFESKGFACVCNGEIYNYMYLFKHMLKNYHRETENDCEVIIPLFIKFHHKISGYIRGEFAMVIKFPDGSLFAMRDHCGIRPLFIGETQTQIILASESKSIPPGFRVMQFPPGHYWYSKNREQFISFINTKPEYMSRKYITATRSLDSSALLATFTEQARSIRAELMESVEERMKISNDQHDIGFLVSGGLDSSSIISLATMVNHKHNIHCFTIGLSKDDGVPFKSSDVEAAKIVCAHLKVPLTVVSFTVSEGIAAVPKVIESFETYDVTTIRAGVPMYLLAKYIRENTKIKVVLSGEGSDELFSGYLYTEGAPTLDDLYQDNIRLMNQIHFYDVLRADRAMAAFGLELRVPFLEKNFVDYVQQIHPFFLSQHTKIVYPDKGIDVNPGLGKMLLRMAMAGLLPESIIFRKKVAFSDGVSHAWRQILINHAYNNEKTSEQEWYMKIFDNIYPERRHLIPGMWMPRWADVTDPSATVLHGYTESM